MTYLFDIGNVLLRFDFEPALKSLMGENPDAQAIAKIIAAKDPFESGETPLQDYLDLVYDLLDYSGTDEHFSHTWNSIFTPIQATWDLAAKLKADDPSNRLILFSNTNPLHGPFCLSHYPQFSLFDHAYFSYQANAIKPDAPFFTRAIEKYQLIPDQTIYIDDLPENIAEGKKHGLRSFCYHHDHHSDLLNWLETQPK